MQQNDYFATLRCLAEHLSLAKYLLVEGLRHEASIMTGLNGTRTRQ